MNWYKNASVIDNPKFKAWFGNSKMVDENGNPRVFYHGSKRPDLKRFDPKMVGTGIVGTQKDIGGFFFTSDRENADFYADQVGDPENRKKIEVTRDDISVYGKDGDWYYLVQMRDWDSEEFDKIEEVPELNDGPYETEEEAIDAGMIAVQEYNSSISSKDGDSDPWIVAVYLKMENPYVVKDKRTWPLQAIKEAREAGCDGVYVEDIVDGYMPSDIAFVFSPMQIKAVKNNGEFSNKTDMIYK